MLAGTPIPFIGLLGPPRRRDDLFKLLTPGQRAALDPRLRAPVGLDLGGQGPEAIALSIAAQLQSWRAQAGE
jgi:xanthine dehydrogenase accessory factor